LDELSSMLKGNVRPPGGICASIEIVEEAIQKAADANDTGDVEEKKDSSSDGSEEESSTDSVDSDVARLIAKFDLETLHKIVEQLDDELMKKSHCSKPDYVCAQIAKVQREQNADKGEGGASLVPLLEGDEASVGSHSDSGISTTARKRHLHQ